MRKIFTIGEALLDIIFKDGKPLAASAGGAMLNTAVSLGRMRLPAYLISEYGNDQAGQLIDNFLRDNNVHDNYITRYDIGKTAIALAFLDENNEASYTFFKSYPEKRLSIDIPQFSDKDIFLYGSFYSIVDEVRKTMSKIVNRARSSGSLLIYDPNIRSPHKKDIPELIVRIRENIEWADLVRASDEDFHVIFDVNDPESAFDAISELGSKILIYTMSGKGVYLMKKNLTRFYEVPDIETVSTIGAGDSFNAGLIYGLYKNQISRAELKTIKDEEWDELIGYGIRFATDVCKSLGNYISMDLVRELSRT